MLKPKEQALIAELRRDGRQTLKRLARKAKLPMSTVHDKLRAWRRDKVIKRFTVEVSPVALGLHAQAMVFFRVPKPQREAFGQALATREEVERYWRVNNGFDYLAEIAAQDFLALEAFLEHLDDEYQVQAKEAHYLLEEGEKAPSKSRPSPRRSAASPS